MLPAIRRNSVYLFGEPFWKVYCAVPAKIHKQGKYEPRYLIISKFRLYVVSSKAAGKLTTEVVQNVIFVKALHYRGDQLGLSIQRQSGKTNAVTFTCTLAAASALACSLANSLNHYFPGWPVSSLVNIQPTSLLANKVAADHLIDYPCGNFRWTYEAVADSEGCPLIDEIAWDIEKIYAFHEWKTLNLNDFSHFTARELTPLILALRYSPWFTGIWADSIRLSNAVAMAITKAVGEWSGLRSIRLIQCGLKHDFITALMLALTQNPNLHLDDVDLSFNDFDDYDSSSDSISEHLDTSKAVQLSNIRSLRFRRCGLTFKTLRCIMNVFTASATRRSSLRVLDVSGNMLKSKRDEKVLYGILPYTPELTELNLSFSGVRLAEIWSCLKCCGQNIAVLKIAGCHFHTKKNRQLTCQASIKDYFANATMLRHLDISQAIRMSPETLRSILMGLVTNQSISDIALAMNSMVSTGQELLSTLETSLPKLQCVSHLYLRDNEFNYSVPEIISAISEMPNLEVLDIGGKNFNVKRGDSTTVPKALQALAKIINKATSKLVEVNISDANLGTPSSILLSALVSAPTLQRLNICGNCIEDAGARLLAKVLMTNCCLEKICLDRNQITLSGFKDIANSLRENSTLTEMEFPIIDISRHTKVDREHAEAIMKEIEAVLHRNAVKCNTEEANTTKLRRIAKWSLIRAENEFTEFIRETEMAMIKCYCFSEYVDDNPVSTDLTRRWCILKNLLTSIFALCENSANEPSFKETPEQLASKIRSAIDDFYSNARATFNGQQKNFQLLHDTMEEKASHLLKTLHSDHDELPAYHKARAYRVATDLITTLAEAVLASVHEDRQVWVSYPSPTAQKRVLLPSSKGLQMPHLRTDIEIPLIQDGEQQNQQGSYSTKSEAYSEANETTFYGDNTEALRKRTIRKDNENKGYERFEWKYPGERVAIARTKPAANYKPFEGTYKTSAADASLIIRSTSKVMNWDSLSIYSERAIDCPSEHGSSSARKQMKQNKPKEQNSLSSHHGNLRGTLTRKYSSESAIAVNLSPMASTDSNSRNRSTCQQTTTTPLLYSAVTATLRSRKFQHYHLHSSRLHKRLFHSTDELANLGAKQNNVDGSPPPATPFYDAKENGTNEFEM
uniref:Carm_PH domain-containing protein n=1 Tax=Trichuris muris TaxID=70415 RepID=A0A5S6Q9P6_TRIMR